MNVIATFEHPDARPGSFNDDSLCEIVQSTTSDQPAGPYFSPK
jgi:hypothetical protein